MLSPNSRDMVIRDSWFGGKGLQEYVHIELWKCGSAVEFLGLHESNEVDVLIATEMEVQIKLYIYM